MYLFQKVNQNLIYLHIIKNIIIPGITYQSTQEVSIDTISIEFKCYWIFFYQFSSFLVLVFQVIH